nr:phospholipase D family protein [uncultured Ottowia sp.]
MGCKAQTAGGPCGPARICNAAERLIPRFSHPRTDCEQVLNTSGINYHLEEIIKGARDRLIIISPYLKLNDRIRELLEDKDRLKIDVRIIYGKADLHPEEVKWLRNLKYVRTSYCNNLHAKCYLSENACIIGSLNLYSFSQINNNEMGIFIERQNDHQLYQDAYEEAQRLIRISEEVRISLEVVEKDAHPAPKAAAHHEDDEKSENASGLLTTSKLAQKHKMKTEPMLEKLTAAGYLEWRDDKHFLTEQGKKAGGQFKTGRFGAYFLWPEDLVL